MPDPETSPALRQIIRAELAKPSVFPGIITFARFMELALYCPLHGFYEQKPDTVGRAGDFYTSVSAGPLFGELLAFQFASWLTDLEPGSTSPAPRQNGERAGVRGAEVDSVQSPHTLQLVEAGAHDGRLAADILTWLQAYRPQLYERLQYVILEPSATRQAWQQHTLSPFAPRVRWLNPTQTPDPKPQTPTPEFTGIVFSNELLDAMPVHRLGWDAAARQWFEWGVTCAGDRFTWTRLPANLQPPTFNLQLPNELLSLLPDGYTIEVSPAAEQWWRAAAGSLAAGKLVTIDYGLTADELLRPERPDGTLRAYRQHRVSRDLLADPGAQDLTAHVNFTAIQRAGEAVGLRTAGLWPQANFLTRIAEQTWKDPAAFGHWTPAHTRQFQTLTHPDHLGRAFRVLVQSR